MALRAPKVALKTCSRASASNRLDDAVNGRACVSGASTQIVAGKSLA
jgi:hypothetical protein